METLNAVFAWLLRTSWQASVLVGLVLLTQGLFRKKLSPGWRYALWMLVLARLVMPVSPQSPASLFNLTRISPLVPLGIFARQICMVAGLKIDRLSVVPR